MPAAVATSGGLSALTLRALRAIETACGAERDELVACVLDAVMRANASIVQSAHYRSNLAVRSARTARGCCVFSKDGIVAHSQVIRSRATSHVAHPIADLAEDTDFWANVLRYISYFFSVLLGTAYVAIKPLIELLKRPTTAVLVIAGVAVVYIFVSTTVGAMLGMNDIIEYSPSSIVTPAL